MTPEPEPQSRFVIVANQSGRRSIWPLDRVLPEGWSQISSPASKETCFKRLRGEKAEQPDRTDEVISKTLDFSLMFFGDSEQDHQGDRYRLLMESARFADQNGFRGLWLPERHFTQLGCLYPSPAVLHAAVARETKRLRLCAGSVVMPLNDPVRVAEQWSVVDNLSQGRVEVAFASGWHANDFALMPEAYEQRSQRMYDGIADVERLWRGDSVTRRNGAGDTVQLRTYPTPIQSRLPVWLTAAGNPDTFRRAGELGYGVLTHLFNQDISGLARSTESYRDARKRAGHVGTGSVAVTLHTFVGESLAQVRRDAGRPYCDYLRSNLPLLKQLAFSQGQSIDAESLSAQELNQLIQWLFEKYVGGRSLMGTVESCSATCRELAGIGVTEIVCLMDFGPQVDTVLEHLDYLNRLKETMDVE